eukprot:185009_1
MSQPTDSTLIEVGELKHQTHETETKIDVHDLMKPLVDDYIMCKNKSILNCHAIQRILHLLRYYNTIQIANDEEKSILIHTYLLQFTYYNISSVMEDWYHCKKMHLIMQKDVETFVANNKEIQCTNSDSCGYFIRYHRDRSKEIFNDSGKDIDYQRNILMDQLDSIHSYVLHSSLRRQNITPQNKYFPSSDLQLCEDHSESEDETKENAMQITFEQDLWENQPNSISHCSVAQIEYILNYENIIEISDKLKPLKFDIIKYIKDNEFDGNKIIKMQRKPFIKEFVKYFKDNKKLSVDLGKLYNGIIKYDVPKLINRLFLETKQKTLLSHQPKTIKECNIDQIAHIVNSNGIFDDLDKLKQHKCSVIHYLKENKYNGNKFIDLTRKQFITAIAEYLDNDQLKPQISQFYNKIINFIPNEKHENEEAKTSFISNKSSKFVTAAQYSFGKQYRYTKNFSQHPWYIKPAYPSIKQELMQYFISKNEERDEKVLFAAQLETINSMHSDVRTMLVQLVAGEHKDFEDNVFDYLIWVEEKNEHINEKK